MSDSVRRRPAAGPTRRAISAGSWWPGGRCAPRRRAADAFRAASERPWSRRIGSGARRPASPSSPATSCWARPGGNSRGRPGPADGWVPLCGVRRRGDSRGRLRHRRQHPQQVVELAHRAQALVPLGTGAADRHADQRPVLLVPHDLGAVGCGVREGDHAAIAGAPGGVQVGGVHHPRADRAQQPNVVLARLFEAFEPHVDDDVGAHLAVQRDHGGDFLEVEDEDRLAADLAQHDVAGRDIAAHGRHHAALPALEDLGGFLLVVESVRPCPRLATPAPPAASIDVDVQQHRRADEAQRGEREPEREPSPRSLSAVTP